MKTWTTSNAANIVVTWTSRIGHRPAHFVGGWWGLADVLGHQLKLPHWIMRPICDHFDIAVGVPKDNLVAMDYAGHAPWWLR